MKSEKQKARRREIEAAAFRVLAKKGYKAASMLAIAREASASNETMYRWYGNKQDLFRSLIEENCKNLKRLLERGIEDELNPLQTIKELGPLLLRFVAYPEAIIINRAAVSDAVETGMLGKTIDTAERGAIMERVVAVFKKALETGQLRFDNAQEAAEIYIRLLFGELQIRQAMGTCGALDDAECHRRAGQAFDLTIRLYGVKGDAHALSL